MQIDNLDADSARQLISSLVPADALSENLLVKIQNKTQGNPFFIEEIIRSIFSDNSTTLSGKEQAIDAMKMPYSIQMALAERIDRLPKNIKQYLQILSVVGMKCKASLFAKLISMRLRAAMEMLSELQELGFVFISNSDDQPVAQFVHVLTQEVAYSTLLAERRASLHESIADTMKAESGERLQDLLPELAHHYCQSRNDLKALEHLRLAGESAIQRSANQEAQNYLRLGLTRLEKAPQIANSFTHLSHLWLSLGVSLQVTLGYAAEEVRTAYENAVYYSKMAFSILSGEIMLKPKRLPINSKHLPEATKPLPLSISSCMDCHLPTWDRSREAPSTTRKACCSPWVPPHPARSSIPVTPVLSVIPTTHLTPSLLVAWTPHEIMPKRVLKWRLPAAFPSRLPNPGGC
jgi:predicted ATPase